MGITFKQTKRKSKSKYSNMNLKKKASKSEKSSSKSTALFGQQISTETLRIQTKQLTNVKHSPKHKLTEPDSHVNISLKSTLKPTPQPPPIDIHTTDVSHKLTYSTEYSIYMSEIVYVNDINDLIVMDDCIKEKDRHTRERSHRSFLSFISVFDMEYKHIAFTCDDKDIRSSICDTRSSVCTDRETSVPSILNGTHISIISTVCGVAIIKKWFETIAYQNIELIPSYKTFHNKPNINALIKNVLLQCTNKKRLNEFIVIFDELLYVCDENIMNKTFTIDKITSQLIFNKLFLLLNGNKIAKQCVKDTSFGSDMTFVDKLLNMFKKYSNYKYEKYESGQCVIAQVVLILFKFSYETIEDNDKCDNLFKLVPNNLYEIATHKDITNSYLNAYQNLEFIRSCGISHSLTCEI